jgi:hypothetical protein
MQQHNIDRIDVIPSWVTRRIAPLPFRPRLLCEYSGIEEVSRATHTELSAREIDRVLYQITTCMPDHRTDLVIPHSVQRLVPDVSSDLLFLSIVTIVLLPFRIQCFYSPRTIANIFGN